MVVDIFSQVFQLSRTQKEKMGPNQEGRYGDFGGRLVPESLVGVLEEVDQAYESALNDQEFGYRLDMLAQNYVGRPSPLWKCENFCRDTPVAIYLKREDLNHTGSHKINNVLGQVLLAQRMGKTRVIAETGAGQHGVATATACALIGLDCEIYMGEVDVIRQSLNVARMRLLGAKVTSVQTGTKTLKDAITVAMRDWVTRTEDTYYCFGTAAGPHPFPRIVRDLQKVIGIEARQQILEQTETLPQAVFACIGGGSNAIGIFHGFLDDPSVALIGCEAAGEGVSSGRHAAALSGGSPGIFQGSYSYLLQNEHGQISPSHSISAGLDYPGVGPEHAFLLKTSRAQYIPITDTQAMDALQMLSHAEGIIPAIETAHALAGARDYALRCEKPANIIVNLSGRGDKDVDTASNWFSSHSQ